MGKILEGVQKRLGHVLLTGLSIVSIPAAPSPDTMRPRGTRSDLFASFDQ